MSLIKRICNIFYFLFFYFLNLLPPYFLLSSLLGLHRHNVDLPLRMAGLMLCDLIACLAKFCQVKVGINPFTQRKDSYSLSPVDSAHFQRHYFEELKLHMNAKIILLHVKNSWRTAASYSGLVETILRRNYSISELASPGISNIRMATKCKYF